MTALAPRTAGSSRTKESFPRQYARTQRFTLGAPRAVATAPDGTHALFLRSRSGADRVGCLWIYDIDADEERLLVDPRDLLGDDEELPAEERARRERAREGGAGIVGFGTDTAVRCAAFALSGRLFVCSVPGGDVRELPVPGPVVDPRPDPTASRVAYVCNGALRVAPLDGTADRALLEPDAPDVTWGLAEFVAAEEMGRSAGYWWAPDGTALLAARVDEAPVQRWHVADAAQPATEPAELAYPAAGTPNADVRLARVHLDGRVEAVEWDRNAYPYLASVHWSRYGDPLLLVQARDQRRASVLAVDAQGVTRLLRELTDPCWLDLVPGVPAWTPEGRLVTAENDDEDTRRVRLDGAEVTPAGLHVQAVLGVDDQGVLFAGSADPTQIGVWNVTADKTVSPVAVEPGRHSAGRTGALLLVSTASMNGPGTRTRLVGSSDGSLVHEFVSYAETPVLRPRVELLTAGRRGLRTAVLLPTGWEPGTGPLPVLMDPYGGPGAQRVIEAQNAYLSSQWLADQGFAVVVTDGRGTPGRSWRWERTIAYDLAGPTLEDQVDALHAVAEQRPYLDLSRVAIRGWSFGGYLAALAVLRRPDVFAAAVAGAPVTDWSLYDTHYTERYLGTPQEHPEAYERSSLLADAHRLERPLMLIHGLADDNVVAAHTLRLSSALLAAGRPHTVLPLSGVTHMTPQETVAENLLLLQVAFLRDALGLAAGLTHRPTVEGVGEDAK